MELLRRVDHRIGLFALELLAIVDAAPGHGDGMHPGCLRGADVERRVAHVGALARCDLHALRREQQRLRVWLVPLRLVAADDRFEQMAERDAREGELYRHAALRRDDRKPPALL